MKLVLICGSCAVGKMSVGQALMEQTGLRLFHNHMTIEPVIEIFGYFDSKVIARLREVIFEEFAASSNEGLIFTYVWAFDQPSDWDYIRHVTELFESKGAEIYCVELVAPQEIRLKRNEGESRLQHKASKRNLEFSRNNLLESDAHYRLESFDGELPFQNYIKIDNSNLSPAEAAAIIKETFRL